MIINIRGTGGAGKSYIVREVMKRYNDRVPSFVERRKQPISYLCSREGGNSLFVPGHYETPTGGCDTIQTVPKVYEYLVAAVSQGHDALYEGIMLCDDVKTTAMFNKHYPIKVIALTTSLEQCLASIQDRRDARGDDRPLSPKKTTERYGRLPRMITRLKDAGVECQWLNRDEALKTTLALLGW